MSPTCTDLLTEAAVPKRAERLRWSPLIALAAAAFLVIVTEALPAGVLPEMARSLHVGESAMGQSLTVYALATGLSAIPVARATASWDRRRLLLTAVVTFTLADAVTTVSSSYVLTMASRLLAGVAAAVVWAELVGFARRLAPPRLHGRATAVAMAGVPLALCLGIPMGTLLGGLAGWRTTFAAVTVLSVALVAWLAVSAPGAPGRGSGEPGERVIGALRVPGVVAVLVVTATYVLAHNVLYTYIAAFLDSRGMGGARDTALLVLGAGSVVGIGVTGALIDRALRLLTIASVALFLLAAAVLALPERDPFVVYGATALWGVGWGCVSTLLPTAVAEAGGDRAQPLLVTTWNTAMGLGGAAGGVLLGAAGPSAFPRCVLALLTPALTVTVAARSHAFPVKR